MRIGAFVLIVALVSGCGGNSPTAPTPSPIPQINGQWRGPFSVTGCAETGLAVGSGACALLQSGTISFTPQQSGGNVSGPLIFGQVSVQVSGTIDNTGVLVLAGNAPQPNGFTVTVTTFRATVTGSSMSGTFAFSIIGGVPSGGVLVNGSFSMTR